MSSGRFALFTLMAAALGIGACVDNGNGISGAPARVSSGRDQNPLIRAQATPSLPSRRPVAGVSRGTVKATGPVVGGGGSPRVVINCEARVDPPVKSAEVPGTINVVATVSCDGTVDRLYEEVGLYRGEDLVNSQQWVNLGQAFLWGNVAQDFCADADYTGGSAVKVTWPPGFTPPESTLSITSDTVHIGCGCLDQHPNLRICGGLPEGYIYSSAGAALAEMKRQTGDLRLKLHSNRPATSGPCVTSGGIHWNVRAGSEPKGSIGCCPCCEDTPSGPLVQERCKILNIDPDEQANAAERVNASRGGFVPEQNK